MTKKLDLHVLVHTGEALRRLRESRRLLQGELSDRSGVGQSQISTYELGRSVPSLSTLDRLIHALDAGLLEFLVAMLEATPRGVSEEAVLSRRELGLFALGLDAMPADQRASAFVQLESFARLLRTTLVPQTPDDLDLDEEYP